MTNSALFFILPTQQNVNFVHTFPATSNTSNYLTKEAMATQTLSTATAGLIFGAALSAAGVASPSIITDQLRLENFHMLEVFLTATASSA